MSEIYLIPSVLAPDAIETIPAYVLAGIKKCTVIFAEQERTARRFFKQLDKSIVIDDFEWFNMSDKETDQEIFFRQKIKEDKNIGIVSEAGCPGIADPGQRLVAIAQQLNIPVKPLVGPSSILLSLMASGLNGQQFEFVGYLPIEAQQRTKKILELESSSRKNNSTKIFIETPYRNNQLLEALLKTCEGQTQICIASNISAANEKIKTLTVGQWKNNLPELHKQLVIFLMYAGT